MIGKNTLREIVEDFSKSKVIETLSEHGIGEIIRDLNCRDCLGEETFCEPCDACNIIFSSDKLSKRVYDFQRP